MAASWAVVTSKIATPLALGLATITSLLPAVGRKLLAASPDSALEKPLMAVVSSLSVLGTLVV